MQFLKCPSIFWLLFSGAENERCDLMQDQVPQKSVVGGEALQLALEAPRRHGGFGGGDHVIRDRLLMRIKDLPSGLRIDRGNQNGSEHQDEYGVSTHACLTRCASPGAGRFLP
jgi:hypothetical protein